MSLKPRGVCRGRARIWCTFDDGWEISQVSQLFVVIRMVGAEGAPFDSGRLSANLDITRAG